MTFSSLRTAARAAAPAARRRRHALELGDQVAVVARRLGLVALELIEQRS